MSTAKIRIKIGGVEIDCEATEAFVKDELPTLLESVSSLYQQAGRPPDQARQSGGSGGGSGASIQGATSMFAQKLGVKSGPDLIIAAAARLTFAVQQESFTREQLTNEMKTATGYFQKNYVGNMTKYLTSLIKSGDLVEQSANTYALSSDKRTELEPKLA